MALTNKDIFETYETVTVSFFPIAEQIRRHFPPDKSPVSTTPSNMTLPILLTKTQILHALATPPIRNGIIGIATNMMLMKKIVALEQRLAQEQKTVFEWHDELIEIHNDPKNKKDYAVLIEQLSGSAKKILRMLQGLRQVKTKIQELIITQNIVTTAQDKLWLKYENEFFDAIIAEMDKQGRNFDKNIQENVLKQHHTLETLTEKFKKHGFPIPEYLNDG